MKSYGKLWEKVVDKENFLAAWKAFRRNHPSMPAVKKFERNLEGYLTALRREVEERTWQPSDYHHFMVYEPKPRLISSVPVRDRVVHHALCRVITPLMERRFIRQSYACRTGFGSHLACRRARELAGKHPYFLKIDVRKYFDSVDHEMLLGLLESMFREAPLKAILRQIVEKPINPGRGSKESETKGLPIGNLTSQWFANLYLDEFDHYCTEGLRFATRYIRYMDDILVFFDTKEEAWAAHGRMRAWLDRERKLALKEEATKVAPVTDGIPFLGLVIKPGNWRMKPSRLRRTRKSMRRHFVELKRGETTPEKVENVFKAMDGSAMYFGFKNIYNHVLRQFCADAESLTRDSGVAASLQASAVNRGGNYNNGANNCSSAGRNTNNVPGNVNDNIGARLASVSLAAPAANTAETAHNSTVRPHPEAPAPGTAAGTKMPTPMQGEVGANCAQPLCRAPLQVYKENELKQ